MSKSSESIKEVKRRIKEIDPANVQRAIDESPDGEVVLLDVRERHEFDAGHIEGSLHIPIGDLVDRVEDAVSEKDRRVIAYCAVGKRSALAADTMTRELGYKNVESMRGGITLWKERGYEFVKPSTLSEEQSERYSRHILIPEVGVQGQRKLLDAKVLLIGAGGLGSPAALYLAAAGVGTLGIVDDDVVDASNLQRQVVHTTARIGQPKVDSARETVSSLNPDVEVVGHNTRLAAENVVEIIQDYDIVLDGADNFPTRYLLNDASVLEGKPVVHSSILGFDGQLTVFVPREGPCYRCLYPKPPPAELAPSCAANGVLGVLPGIMGLLQANEVVKLVIGVGEPLVGRLLLFEALTTRFTELKIRRDPDCPVCGEDAEPVDLGKVDYEEFCAATA